MRVGLVGAGAYEPISSRIFIKVEKELLDILIGDQFPYPESGHMQIYYLKSNLYSRLRESERRQVSKFTKILYFRCTVYLSDN